jgi:hypothetical protein
MKRRLKSLMPKKRTTSRPSFSLVLRNNLPSRERKGKEIKEGKERKRMTGKRPGRKENARAYCMNEGCISIVNLVAIHHPKSANQWQGPFYLYYPSWHLIYQQSTTSQQAAKKAVFSKALMLSRRTSWLYYIAPCPTSCRTSTANWASKSSLNW